MPKKTRRTKLLVELHPKLPWWAAPLSSTCRVRRNLPVAQDRLAGYIHSAANMFSGRYIFEKKRSSRRAFAPKLPAGISNALECASQPGMEAVNHVSKYPCGLPPYAAVPWAAMYAANAAGLRVCMKTVPGP